MGQPISVFDVFQIPIAMAGSQGAVPLACRNTLNHCYRVFGLLGIFNCVSVSVIGPRQEPGIDSAFVTDPGVGVPSKEERPGNPRFAHARIHR